MSGLQYGIKFSAGKSEYKVMTRMKRREEARLVLCGEEIKRVHSATSLKLVRLSLHNIFVFMMYLVIPF